VALSERLRQEEKGEGETNRKERRKRRRRRRRKGEGSNSAYTKPVPHKLSVTARLKFHRSRNGGTRRIRSSKITSTP
jgi:Mg-chelatase subunit ChlD